MHGNDHIPGGPDPIPGAGLVGSFGVTISGDQPEFEPGAGIVLPSEDHVTAPLDLILWDGSGWFDTGTNAYTAGLDGIYRFTMMCDIGSSTSVNAPNDGRITDPGQAYFALNVNVGTMSEVDWNLVSNEEHSWVVGDPRPYGGITVNGSIDLQLVATDQVVLDLFHINDPDSWDLGFFPYLFGSYLGAIA